MSEQRGFALYRRTVRRVAAAREARLAEALDEIANLKHDIERHLEIASAQEGEIASLRAQLASARKALEWVRDQRWDENADLDTICTHAERALTDEEGKS